MKGFKGFIIMLIIILTASAILYLFYQAKRLERYTSAVVEDKETYYLIYSSKSAISQDGKDIGELLKYIRNQLKDSGYGASVIEYKNKEAFEREAQKKIKGSSSQFILMDVGLSNLVISKNTILIRTGFDSSDKSRDNIEFANSIKKRFENESVKINVLPDSKNNWNGELGNKSIRIEIADRCTLDDARELLSIIVKLNH